MHNIIIQSQSVQNIILSRYTLHSRSIIQKYDNIVFPIKYDLAELYYSGDDTNNNKY